MDFKLFSYKLVLCEPDSNIIFQKTSLFIIYRPMTY